MKEWLVHYNDRGVDLIFRCWADDEKHAREQCMNAEPHCIILFVERR
jgi:hypothetical protein